MSFAQFSSNSSTIKREILDESILCLQIVSRDPAHRVPSGTRDPAAPPIRSVFNGSCGPQLNRSCLSERRHAASSDLHGRLDPARPIRCSPIIPVEAGGIEQLSERLGMTRPCCVRLPRIRFADQQRGHTPLHRLPVLNSQGGVYSRLSMHGRPRKPLKKKKRKKMQIGKKPTVGNMFYCLLSCNKSRYGTGIFCHIATGNGSVLMRIQICRIFPD